MKKMLKGFIWVFYVFIILYAFFAVLNINTLENFASALAFEIIGFLVLAYFVFSNKYSNTIKVGYFVPLVTITVIYTVVLDTINLVLVSSINTVIFTMIHLVVLFIYCLLSIPMYIMGRR